MNMRTITFNELRKIKDSLPSGSMQNYKYREKAPKNRQKQLV